MILLLTLNLSLLNGIFFNLFNSLCTYSCTESQVRIILLWKCALECYVHLSDWNFIVCFHQCPVHYELKQVLWFCEPQITPRGGENHLDTFLCAHIPRPFNIKEMYGSSIYNEYSPFSWNFLAEPGQCWFWMTNHPGVYLGSVELHLNMYSNLLHPSWQPIVLWITWTNKKAVQRWSCIVLLLPVTSLQQWCQGSTSTDWCNAHLKKTLCIDWHVMVWSGCPAHQWASLDRV